MLEHQLTPPPRRQQGGQGWALAVRMPPPTRGQDDGQGGAGVWEQ